MLVEVLSDSSPTALACVLPPGRVSHFGFFNNDPWLGWGDTLWTGYNESFPRPADEAINLNFFFDFLDPGASVSFTWVYILRTEDLLTAMNQVWATGLLSQHISNFMCVVLALAPLSMCRDRPTPVFRVGDAR